jgi:hypothetical protein
MWHPFTSWLWWIPNHLNIPPELRLDPMPTTPSVALVDPQVLEARELIVGAFEQQRHGRAILNVRGVHLRTKNEATGIDEYVAFSTIDAFGSVVATDAPDTCGANRLAVDDAGARLRVAPDSRSELLA